MGQDGNPRTPVHNAPKCPIQVLPAASLLIPSGHTVLDHFTPPRLAPFNVEPPRLALVKLAPSRLEPHKFAPIRLAPARLAPLRTTPLRFVPCRLLLLR